MIDSERYWYVKVGWFIPVHSRIGRFLWDFPWQPFTIIHTRKGEG